jgi:hypothetical protein
LLTFCILHNKTAPYSFDFGKPQLSRSREAPPKGRRGHRFPANQLEPSSRLAATVDRIFEL